MSIAKFKSTPTRGGKSRPRVRALPAQLKAAAAQEHGAGRWVDGRKGVENVYLSTEYQTAIDEYRKVSSLLPPGTLVRYNVEIAGVTDFRKAFDPAAGWAPIWEDFYCDWRRLAIVERLEPPSLSGP